MKMPCKLFFVLQPSCISNINIVTYFKDKARNWLKAVVGANLKRSNISGFYIFAINSTCGQGNKKRN